MLTSKTIIMVVFSSVQSLSRVRLLATPWTAAHQASLSITNSQMLLNLMSIELVTPSNHLILCHSLLLLPSIFPSIRVFSNESALHIRWPKYWEFQLQHQSFQWTPRTCLKETINKAKIQPSEWETMFANEAADEGLTSKADKQLSSPNFRLSGERLTQVAHLWFSSLRRPWSVSGLVWAALLTVGQAQLAPVMQTHRRLFLRKQTSCWPGEEPLAGLFVLTRGISVSRCESQVESPSWRSWCVLCTSHKGPAAWWLGCPPAEYAHFPGHDRSCG